MIALIQRVCRARVSVRDSNSGSLHETGAIGPGLLALVALERADTAALLPKMLHKLLNYRVFSDSAGKMNLSLKDLVPQAGLLLVSQFTLAADTNSGLRPSFTPAAEPAIARDLFGQFIALARTAHPIVETGEFGADMQVELVNDGPVTFTLRV